MGISCTLSKLIMRSPIDFHGAVCQLGNQNIRFNSKQLMQDAEEVYFSIKSKTNFKRGVVASELYFNALGFNQVESIDISSNDKPSFIEDLGEDISNTKLINNFDLVFDGGTLEHIFNPDKALNNIKKMLKLNGHIIHQVPCNNQLEHGFFQFSPSYLNKFYEENNFLVKEILLICVGPPKLDDFMRVNVYVYDKEEVFRMHSKGINLPSTFLLMHFVAQKIAEDKLVIPKVDIQAEFSKMENQSKNIGYEKTNFLKSFFKSTFPNIWRKMGILKAVISRYSSTLYDRVTGHNLKKLGKF
jgi:SAM-dependent methyltransferase